ncbi:MAG: M20/M25/M40 family metallo-hydrolase [Bacteroidales bacterium]|nr:MAG: M20/M25/M40 family metallo-hydrolase [Bacteroidales bacterium]
MHSESIELLKKLISTPSFSKEEDGTADIIYNYLVSKGLNPNRHLNNIWIEHNGNKPNRPTVLLNSHHDTVKPSAGWVYDPFTPTIVDGKLIGLGSNDAGASLVSLLAVFLKLNQRELPYNLIFSATAEEENSGENGIESILDKIGKIDLAIVGEPTKMELAVGERGLMVLDCKVLGKSGHAARNEGVNAIYKALPVIEWFKNFHFPMVSDVLGEVKMTVTQINAGYQHNVVPDVCDFVVDVRTNDLYSNAKALSIILEKAKCEITPRSLRLNSSKIEPNHPIAISAKKLGLPTYGSPTTSDQAVIPYPSVKIGPGDSARSHTANEFIYLEEIKSGIEIYSKLLENLIFEHG